MRSITTVCFMLMVFNYLTSARNIKLTYYWIVFEEDYPISADHILKNCNGGTLAIVSKHFWNSLHIECSGRLRTGQYINGGDSNCNCFKKISGPFGAKGNRLRPYISIAANDIPYGTKVFIRELQNITLPNGRIHNGCVRVDDVGWNFGNNRIDFYVVQKSNSEKLSSHMNEYVDIVVNANCILQKYDLFKFY